MTHPDPEIDTADLIETLANRAATAARAVTKALARWDRSHENHHADYQARYAARQARGKRVAYARAIAALQPVNALPATRQYRTNGGGVDVEAYAAWVTACKAAARSDSGGRTEGHGARGAAMAYSRIRQLLETDYDVDTTASMALESTPEWTGVTQ